MAGWTDLPLDILVLIAQNLSVIEEFASFSAICRDCRLIGATLRNKISLTPRYPQLMLAENKHAPSLRGFLNLTTSTAIEVELPEAIGSFCLGAHYGWLFTLGFDLQINLLHPFSRQKIGLPSMLTLPDQVEYDEECTPQLFLDMFVKKIAILENPLNGNNPNNECIIVAIYGEFRILAYARFGDTVWTNIQIPFHGYKDVVYYKGKFYAVGSTGIVVVCDIDDNNGPKATVVAPIPCRTYYETQKYLVESSGDLLLVLRVPMLLELEKKRHYYTNAVSIWRLDDCHEEGNKYPYNWTEVTTLGDRALFLGRNVSTSKAASNGIKANCIYFTDDYEEQYYNEPDGGGWDTIIFNVENKTIDRFDCTRESLSKISPPLWYT